MTFRWLKPGRWLKSGLFLFLGAALLVASPAFAQKSKEKGAKQTLVDVDAVRATSLNSTVPVIGRLVARQSGVVSALMSGVVVQMAVQIGDRVERGAVLAELSPSRLRWALELRVAEVSQTKAALKTTKAQIRLRRQELKRLENLRQSAAFSKARFEDSALELVKAQSASMEAQSNLKRAQANLELAKIDLGNTIIRAPYNGVVSVRSTEVGTFLNIGQPVVTLVNDKNLDVEAQVPTLRLAGLTVGTEIRVHFSSGENFSARVRAVVPNENAITRTRLVRFSPDFKGADVGALATNQSVTLSIPTGAARNVLSVHKDAVLNRSGRNMVYVVEGGTAITRTIKLGEAVGGRFSVKSGLKAGDLVVIRGNERLRPGQKVKAKLQAKPGEPLQ